MGLPAAKFGPVAIFLHWLMAAGVVVGVIFGVISADTNDAALTRETLRVHQSIGVTMFLLGVLRLAWRLTHPAPPLPAAMPRGQKIAAAATHWALYLVLLVMPVTGYLGLAARGREITIFGVFDLPHLVAPNLKLSAPVRSIHEYGQYVLYVLLALHVGAALYHRFVLNDGVLELMWPGRKARSPAA